MPDCIAFLHRPEKLVHASTLSECYNLLIRLVLGHSVVAFFFGWVTHALLLEERIIKAQILIAVDVEKNVSRLILSRLQREEANCRCLIETCPILNDSKAFRNKRGLLFLQILNSLTDLQCFSLIRSSYLSEVLYLLLMGTELLLKRELIPPLLSWTQILLCAHRGIRLIEEDSVTKWWQGTWLSLGEEKMLLFIAKFWGLHEILGNRGEERTLHQFISLKDLWRELLH